jgi:hypothetical protein
MAEKQTRKWEPREMRMVSEYLVKKYSGYRSMTRVRLGALHPELLSPDLSEEEKNMLTVWRRWADAIVITPTTMILIEAAILPDPGDISKLDLYAALLPHTPEFAEYKSFPIVKELVIAIEDPLLVKLAHDSGIRVVVFSPGWVKDYIKTLSHRKQRASKTVLPGP